MENIEEKRMELHSIAHRFAVANDRFKHPVVDYMIGDVLVRESWHPSLKKYILTVDGAATLEEVEGILEKVLKLLDNMDPGSSPPPRPRTPSLLPCAPPSAGAPASPQTVAPPERRSS